MFRSYLIATIRTLLKNRGLTAINILGLAIGMASVILIILYIQYEFSYDRHHAHANRIYRRFSRQCQWRIPHRSIRVHLAHWHRH